MIGCNRVKEIISSPKAKIQVRPKLIANFPRITYKELSDATGGFDIQRIVASARFGHVFRGVLLNGTPIPV